MEDGVDLQTIENVEWGVVNKLSSFIAKQEKKRDKFNQNSVNVALDLNSYQKSCLPTIVSFAGFFSVF